MKIGLKILFLLLIAGAKLFAQPKPNILWITIEDTSPQFVGCYGNKDARTPVIDRLASEGVRFTNAFSTGTVCSPSRTSIITGVKTYETGTGNHRSKYPVPDFIKGFSYYLRKQGYYTSNNKKTDYNVANEKKFISECWNESSGNAGWWGRKTGQPFFAVFNFMDSHQSRTMTQPYKWYLDNVIDKLTECERIKDNEFEMPPFYKDTPGMRKQFARVYNSLKLTDKEIDTLLNRLRSDHLMDSTIIFFFADHGEGEPRGKTNGINLGYRVPFVIWVPEMYRDLSPWGTGVTTDELIDFEDLAPTIISLAGGTVPDYMKGRILMGKNRMQEVNHLVLSADRSDNGLDMVRTVTNGRYVYSRNFMPFMPEARYIRYMEIGEIKQQMRKDFALGKLDSIQESIFKTRPAEFLFDIKNDLWETQNLVNDPSRKSILKRMRQQLDEEVLKSRDIMFLPEYEVESLSDTITAYQFRLNKQYYPLRKIYDAASLSGFRNKRVTAQQIEMLTNQNKIVRYWAALGLRSQSSENLQPYSDEIINAINDDYPPVAITASAIAFQEYNNSLAEKTLKKYCASDNAHLALMAINYLLYITNQTPFIETIKKVHDQKGKTYDVKAACMDFLGALGLVPNTYEYGE